MPATEEKKIHADDHEMVIDTSKMDAGKRAALEVTEAAREHAWTHPSFVGQLFMGKFDPKMIDPFPEQSASDKAEGDALIGKLTKYLSEHLDPDEVDETRTVPKEVISELFKMGVFAMKVPKEYNGLGFSQVNYNRVMSMIASYCGGTAVLISAHQSIGVPQPLKLFGTPEQKKKYLPRFREGSISAFALTEVDVGSDPAKMSTHGRLSPDGKHYVLNGEKLYCTNGPIADVLVVMAQTEPKIVNGKERKQITAFIVEKSFPGVDVLHRCDFMGIRGINNGLMRLKDVKVPVENVIGGPGRGLKIALATLNTGRLTIPAASVGLARQCLSIVRRWSNVRVQWGAPVGKHEEVAKKLSFIASSTFAMEAITWLSSHWADLGDRDIRLEAAMAKYFCSETAWRVIDATLQVRGGRGYEKAASLKARGEAPYPVERMLRDARINTIIEGTSEIMRLFLAREVLDPHMKVAADLIRPNSPWPKKIGALFKMAGFYGFWYPRQWINGSLFRPHFGAGKLATHFRFVDRVSHLLARKLFHAMMRHQAGLERRQLLLGRFVDVGVELFAMAASVSYAKHLVKKNPGDRTPAELADLFCREARRAVERLFGDAIDNDDARNYRLGRKVLDGDMRWMEREIVWVGPDQ